MSTTSLFVDKQDIPEFIADTKTGVYVDGGLPVYGYEKSLIGVTPYITLYFSHPPEKNMDRALKVIEAYRMFNILRNLPIKTYYQQYVGSDFSVSSIIENAKDEVIAPYIAAEPNVEMSKIIEYLGNSDYLEYLLRSETYEIDESWSNFEKGQDVGELDEHGVPLENKKIHLIELEQLVKHANFSFNGGELVEASDDPDELNHPVYLAYLKYIKNDRDDFMLGYSSDELNASPRWGFSSIVRLHGENVYSMLKIQPRWSWLRFNLDTWQDVVLKIINELEPEYCSSGFEVGTQILSDGSPENNVMERILSDYFYGIDIDHPFSMNTINRPEAETKGSQAPVFKNMLPPTWCFLLNHANLAFLNKTEQDLKRYFREHDVKITAVTSGLWIQLSQQPHLYPVENGKPKVLMLANELLKPLYRENNNFTSWTPWEDDPNPRFNRASSDQYMHRFDKDSDWPTSEVKDIYDNYVEEDEE